MKDLFDAEISDEYYLKVSHAPVTLIGKFTVKTHYRLSEDKEKRCKTCEYLCYRDFSKRYYKCAHLGLSASCATDIRVNHVCDLWEQETCN